MTSEDTRNEIITCCYKEPKWSGICENLEYGLDVLKNGIIIDNIKLSGKPFYIIGRYKTCDLIFEHPSLSRFHSVLQYCSSVSEEKKEKGWYIMDLDSTHGTILNKKKIPSHTFVRVHTGHVIKFGGSSRLYIVTGPEEDKEELSRYTWTELTAMKTTCPTEKVADANGYLPPDDSRIAPGCMWGMNDNIDEENLIDSKKLKHEDLYKDDPRKAIKIYFEKEGFDEAPQYEFSKVGFNKNVCKLELPVFGENGEKIVVEVSGSDNKKDLISRCALESCKVLDEMDELYKAGGLGRRQKKDNKYYSEKDYYSSDEDDFFDRTGQIETKRIQRMKRFGVVTKENENIKETKIDAKNSDSLIVKFTRLEQINEEILSIEEQLEEANKAMETNENSTELDEIEKYLEAIQSGAMNKQMRSKLRAKLFELTREENLLRKQLKLSIPVTNLMRKSLYECKERQEIEKISTETPDCNRENPCVDDLQPITKPLIVEKPAAQPCDSSSNDIENDSDEEEIEISNSEKVTENIIEPVNDLKRKLPEKEEKSQVFVENKMKKYFEIENTDGNSEWVPPKDQTGDGRTSLNEKLGY